MTNTSGMSGNTGSESGNTGATGGATGVGSGEAKTGKKSEAEEAAERLYEERMEDEYAKREGGA